MGKRKRYRFSVELPQDIYTSVKERASERSIPVTEQLRRQLDETKTVWEDVLRNGEIVTLNGKSKHIIAYLQDFLFTPERAKTRVNCLSGGDRNRLLLAQLFTKPAII